MLYGLLDTLAMYPLQIQRKRQVGVSDDSRFFLFARIPSCPGNKMITWKCDLPNATTQVAVATFGTPLSHPSDHRYHR